MTLDLLFTQRLEGKDSSKTIFVSLSYNSLMSREVYLAAKISVPEILFDLIHVSLLYGSLVGMV